MPPLDEAYRAPDRFPASNQSLPLALVAIGGIGEPHARDARMRAELGRRLEGAPGAPVLVLGDAFLDAGLLGFCPDAAPARASELGCDSPEPSDAQFDAILAPYARSFAGHPVVVVPGSADHAGDPAATANACARIPKAAPGWRDVACEDSPAARLDAGALALVLVDSARMLDDEAYRERALAALHGELASLRQERPGAWLVLATYHPLESYGARNGADLQTALHKDLYPLLGTVLWPIAAPVGWLVGRRAENPYEWGMRGLRRDLYRALAETPVDAVLSGQDESLQLVELDHPGARWQIVSGAGARKSHVKHGGLDLWFANGAARALGLRDSLPAVRHSLVFGAGRGDDTTRAGFGFVALYASPTALRVEFWDLARREPLGVAELSRAGDAPQGGEGEHE
ncbi:MAG TPA: hypothetical protein VMR31_07275 [Myxococcota bacterium]|nr:hypothetical protein [Myxococcota bacterium]